MPFLPGSFDRLLFFKIPHVLCPREESAVFGFHVGSGGKVFRLYLSAESSSAPESSEFHHETKALNEKTCEIPKKSVRICCRAVQMEFLGNAGQIKCLKR
jgi:hypothetical protein